MPNWVGDAVMASPVIEKIKQRHEKASLEIFGSEAICSLFYKDPHIDDFFIYDKKQPKKELLQELTAKEYDYGLLLTNSFSSAWLFYRAKIPYRIGYSKDFRKWLLSKPVRYPKDPFGQHHVKTYQNLIQSMSASKTLSYPKLHLSEQEKECASAFLEKCEVFPTHTLIGLNPDAAFGPSKCWPEMRYRELAMRLLENPKVILFFFGDNKSEEKMERITRDLGPRVFNLAGTTSLRQLMALTHRCDVFISNDSGPMHIAGALGTRVVALFGSTSPEATAPLKNAKVLRKPVGCSPCFKRECPIDFRCMMSISVDEVEKAVCDEIMAVKGSL